MTRRSDVKANTDAQAHPVRKDIRGLIYLLVVVILGGSLLSYHPADQIFWNVTGQLEQAHNLFGTVGAHLAGGMFLFLGFSSFWVVIIFFGMAILSFQTCPVVFPIKTLSAVLFLVVSFAGLLNLQFYETVDFRGGGIIAGGLVGLYVSNVTEGLLNHFGAYIFLVTIFVISLMLVTHLSLGWIFSKLGLRILGLLKTVRNLSIKKRERRKRARKTMAARDKIRSKPKVTIVNPATKQAKKLEQKIFPFMNVAGEFVLPSLELLNEPPDKKNIAVHRESLEMNAQRVVKKLEDFGIEGEVTEVLPGPVITMYEYKPAPGIKISKVVGLSDDLAMALRSSSIRIVPNLPGKAAIGIEIPNNQREMVFLKEILSSPSYRDSRCKLPIGLGKDITGTPVIADLTKMPHLLVAGATGTGKSVSINTMINSILFKVSPDIVRFLMVDPKRIELSIYHDIPHLLHPVVTSPKEATKALRWAVEEMERRYMLLSDRGVRNIETYNRKIVKEAKKDQADTSRGIDKILPYIVIIIDELADLMMAASKEVEEAITRLAQMARAAGMHLIIATQRPSVNVLTGIIKANFPTRISFQVSSKVDSRTILDTNGAEHLLGDGDMLFMPPGVGRMTRIHGPFVSEEEVRMVTDFLRSERKPDYDETILTEMARSEKPEDDDMEFDERYEEAVEFIFKTRQASISMLQRKLRVGYNRAARMIEVMEKEGIVGPSDGVRPREVYGRERSS